MSGAAKINNNRLLVEEHLSLSSAVDEVDVEAGRATDAVDATDAIEVAE